MSWHSRWKKPGPDPFAKPEPIGKVFGCFTVVRSVEPDAHYGLRALVRCTRCGFEATKVLAQLRYAPPVSHRGCTAGQSSGKAGSDPGVTP